MERQEKKEFIRENIIQSLFELLKEKSWESISSTEICTTAGISKRTLYIYFRSQDEMYLELVKRSFIQLTDTLSTVMNLQKTITEKIINLGTTYLQFMLDYPLQGALITGFDESRFKQEYQKEVEEISIIANRYELTTVFQLLNANPVVYNQTLAIFLWSHIQGMAQLVLDKRKWLENYYNVAIHDLIEDQMNFIKNILEGVKNE